MKTRYICLALLACLSTSASAQRVMQVTKTDGSVIEIPVTDVERVSFGEKEAPDAAVVAGLCPDNHHPHKIDMGTAGIWSCCNVGASVPWEYGGYYAWGETAEKTGVYDWSTYVHCDGSSSTCHDIGTDISGTLYDAARANWGAPWRMPTLAECQALVNCTSEWTALNDVNGRKFTGSNGNSIFLPVAGYRADNELRYAGSGGFYWSSALTESSPNRAHDFNFGSGSTHWRNGNRYNGQSVRPVFLEKPVEPDAAVQAGLCPDNNHPHQIDMGEAGIWSCCNVGASAPWEYGGYYAWGETAEKTGMYDWSTYIHCDSSEGTCHDIGTDISGTQYDAAKANWGSSWRMPTFAECKALVNCTFERSTLNGVNGRKFTGSNGNSIFLPAAGGRWYGELNDEGDWGYYWSSTLYENDPAYAYILDFFFSGDYYYFRYDGLSVRPVCSGPDAAVQTGLCPDNNHPHQIDMGEAGIWSCCNVGASAPWEYGGYYAWGETAEKDVYDWSTYTHCDGSSSTCHDIGSDISGTQYDAATANWGAPWRMPTLAECKALLNCSFEWTMLNDVSGRRFTGSNGNSIFLPAAGYRRDGELYDAGSYGYYWSSTLNESDPYLAYRLYFHSGIAYWGYHYRLNGQSVRPVR